MYAANATPLCVKTCHGKATELPNYFGPYGPHIYLRRCLAGYS